MRIITPNKMKSFKEWVNGEVFYGMRLDNRKSFLSCKEYSDDREILIILATGINDRNSYGPWSYAEIQSFNKRMGDQWSTLYEFDTWQELLIWLVMEE